MAPQKGKGLRVTVGTAQQVKVKQDSRDDDAGPSGNCARGTQSIASTSKGIHGNVTEEIPSTSSKRGIKRPLTTVLEEQQREEEQEQRGLGSLMDEETDEVSDEVDESDVSDEDEGGGVAALRISSHTHQEMERIRFNRAMEAHKPSFQLMRKELFEKFVDPTQKGVGIHVSNRVKIYMEKPMEGDPAKWKLYL